MARFDVFRTSDGVLLLDCQTDFLAGIETRLVAPLFLSHLVDLKLPRLTPTFTVDGVPVVMMTTLLAGIPKTVLGRRVGSLADEQDEIKNAIDMLLSGL